MCKCDICMDFLSFPLLLNFIILCDLQFEKRIVCLFHFALLAECDLNFHKSCLEKISEPCSGRRSGKPPNMFDKLIKKPNLINPGRTNKQWLSNLKSPELR